MAHQLESYKRLFRWKQRNIRVSNQQPMNDGDVVTCKHCGNTYFGRFCPNCGQKAKTERFTLSGVIQDFFDVLTNFDHSFIRTLAELFYRPGYMIRDYLEGHRICYFKPLQLLAFLTTLYLAISYVMDFDSSSFFNIDANINTDEISDMAEDLRSRNLRTWFTRIVDIVNENTLLTTLLMVILFSIPAKFCFRLTPFGSEMNLTEHFYARVYIACQEVIVKTLFLPLEHFNSDDFSTIRACLILCLEIWDYAQLMNIGKRRSLRLTITTYCLMFVILLLVIMPIMGIIIHISGNSD